MQMGNVRESWRRLSHDWGWCTTAQIVLFPPRRDNTYCDPFNESNCSIRGGNGGNFLQQRDERGGIADRRSARCARADQRLRDASIEMRKRFSKRGRERVASGHSLRGNAQHGLCEPVDGICCLFERGGLRIATRSCDDDLEGVARV